MMGRRYFTKTARKKAKARGLDMMTFNFGKGYTKQPVKGKSIKRTTRGPAGTVKSHSPSKHGARMIVGSHEHNAMLRAKGRRK